MALIARTPILPITAVPLLLPLLFHALSTLEQAQCAAQSFFCGNAGCEDRLPGVAVHICEVALAFRLKI
eukprot:1160872-Pelagomonas_calceolata.AAC.8